MNEGGLREKARAELRRYIVVSAYLYCCFAVLLLYKAAVLQDAGAGFGLLYHGTAAVKALVLGKFLLIGEALGVGGRATGGTLATRIAIRSVAFFLLLVALSAVEELVVGAAHGRTVAQTVAEFRRDTGLELIARTLVMLLVLIPLVAAQLLRREGRI